jgi:hypothetical protein
MRAFCQCLRSISLERPIEQKDQSRNDDRDDANEVRIDPNPFRNDSILVRNDANLFGNDLIHLRNHRRNKDFEGNDDAAWSYLAHSQLGLHNSDVRCLAPHPSRPRVQGGVVRTGFTGFTGWETGRAAVAAFHPVHPVDPVFCPHRIVSELDALQTEADALNRLPG